MKRLLVVEDHPWVLQSICSVLRRSGMAIASATTVRHAQKRILEDDPYDGVICEHHLSDGTALGLLGWLRWQQRIGIPFLLVARNEAFTSRYAQSFEVLAPPVRADRLLARLNSMLDDEGMLTCQIPFAAEAC